MKHNTKKTIFSFFGPPGSGKGTLAERLVKEQGFKVLSTGNLCRKHVSAGTEFGAKLDGYLKKGMLIPDDLITDMVIDWLSDNISDGKPIILDGFPRTKGQAASFLDYLKEELTDYCFRVILIMLPDEEIIKRLSARRVCENKKCQKPYPASYKNETCEECGGKLIKRDDDRKEIIEERLKFYPDYRDLLLNFYISVGQKIEELNVSNMVQEQVFQTFCAKT